MLRFVRSEDANDLQCIFRSEIDFYQQVARDDEACLGQREDLALLVDH